MSSCFIPINQGFKTITAGRYISTEVGRSSLKQQNIFLLQMFPLNHFREIKFEWPPIKKTKRRKEGRKEGRRILLTRGQVVNHEYLGPTYLPTYLPLQLRTYVHSKLYCLYFEFLKYPRSWPVFKCLRSFFKYTPALRCTSLRCCRPE